MGETQSWRLTMTDTTQNWTFSTKVNYEASLLSAEWIQEAPSSSAGILPLADYGSATFSATVNGDLSPNLAGMDGIAMVDPYGETSNPSSPVSLDAFSTCWGNSRISIAACSAR